MVKLNRFFPAIYSKQETSAPTALFQKLTESLEQSTVKSEQVILPYSPDLLKLSRYLWSSPS